MGVLTGLVAVRPRVRLVPEAPVSVGAEAVELAAGCGQDLDLWQREVLEDGMGLLDSGRWAAFEFGLNVPRQNGKGAVGEARVLWQIARPRQFVLWSSQQQDTSTEAMYRLVGLLEETDDPRLAVEKVRYANGSEGIWLANGSRVRFMTRSKSRARGFSGDLIIFDEAMFLAEYSVAAMLPTLSARENPQVWYMGSAVDQEIHENGVVWARVRERGIERAPRLAYTEFSLDFPSPDAVTADVLQDPESWREANPAFGIRIQADYIESELRALDTRSAAVERFGVGDWPRTDHTSNSPIDFAQWALLEDRRSVLQDPICIGYDLSPSRKGAIAAAGRNQDGDWHVEVIAANLRPASVVPRLVELVEAHQPAVLIRDGYGPVLTLAAEEEAAGLTVTATTTAEHGASCGKLVDAVQEKTLRHLGTSELADAVRGAATRPLGDAWAWSRKSSSVDISPLVAVTLALAAAIDDPGGDVVIW